MDSEFSQVVGIADRQQTGFVDTEQVNNIALYVRIFFGLIDSLRDDVEEFLTRIQLRGGILIALQPLQT